MDFQIEKIFSVLDNFLISLRIHFLAINIIRKGKFVRNLVMTITATLLIFDPETFCKNNYCILPFLSTLPYIENRKQMKFIGGYTLCFLFYCMEYYPVSYPTKYFDIGNLLRNNPFFSNHELFHLSLFYVDNHILHLWRFKMKQKFHSRINKVCPFQDV